MAHDVKGMRGSTGNIFFSEAKKTMMLALPLIAGQVGQMLMGVADTVMIGHVGVVPLAASTFANTLILVPFLFGIGLLSSISIRVSQGKGSGNHDDVKHALRHGTWLALGYGLLVVVLMVCLMPWLGYFGQPLEVVNECPRYLFLATLSLVPALVSMAWKNFGDALSRPWVPFWILFGGVLVNVFLNWIFIYGKLGFPSMELEGAGWATLLARLLVVFVLYFWLLYAPAVREWRPRHWWGKWKDGEFSVLSRLGIPIGFHWLAEVGSFTAAALMVGRLGVVPLAAHQVASTCMATSFMLPLGVSMAITVRMGEVTGEQREGDGASNRLRIVLLGGWVYGLFFSGVTMLVFIFCGEWLSGKIVGDPEVIALASQLLLIAGFFQCVDGFQIISSSALRGVGDVVKPVWLGVISYWGCAIPSSALLCFFFGFGALGVWWGLGVGLSVAAFLLGYRAWNFAGE